MRSSFKYLIDFLEAISDDDYQKPNEILSGASIGDHCRHILDMFLCLEKGKTNHQVCYEWRERNQEFARNKMIYLIEIKRVSELNLMGDIVLHTNGVSVKSSYEREFLFCMDHMIHHMWQIRMAGNAEFGHIIHEHFGVAPSTIQARKEECA